MNGKKAKVKEFFDQFLLQALAEFVALAAVISFLGMYVYDKMDILLIDSLKESIAQQSQSTAYALGERFQHKLDELKSRAELLQEGRISAEDAVEIDTIGTREGRLRGILRRLDGSVRYFRLENRPRDSPISFTAFRVALATRSCRSYTSGSA